MLKSLFFILGSCFITTHVWSQIRAIVVDSETQKPIEGATVLLTNNKDSILSKKILSQENGIFIFKNLVTNETYNLNITYVGYLIYNASIVIKNYNHGTILDTIFLKAEDRLIGTVNIVKKRPLLEFNGNKIILNVAESPLLAAGSIYDAITKVPGVVETNNLLRFRGKGILVLIDNEQIHLKGEDLKEVLSNLPAVDIDKIEILPNPSSNFDGEAQSVINIKTIKNKFDGVSGTYSLGGGIGKNGRYNGGLSLNYKHRAFNMYGNYNYDHNNTFFDLDLDRTLNNTQQLNEHSHETRIKDNYNYKIGIDYNLSKSSILGVSFNGFTNYRTRTDINNVRNIHIPQTADSLTTVKWFGDLRYLNKSSNIYFKKYFDTTGRSLTLNIDYINYYKNLCDDYATNYFSNGSPYLPTSRLRDTTNSISKVYLASLDFSNPIKNGYIDAGLKSTFSHFYNNLFWQYQNADKWLQDSMLTNSTRYNEFVYAAYALFGKKINHFEIAAGVRFEQTHLELSEISYRYANITDFGSFLPSASIQFNKNENTVYSISYKKSILRPAFRDLNPYVNYYSSYSYYTGNPNLKPQYDNNINISYSHKNAITINLDYTHSTNVILPIVLKGQDNALYYTMANIEFSDLVGLSTIYSKQVNKLWSFNISNALQYLTFSKKGINGLTNTGFTYVGNIQNIFTLNNGWSAELTGNYNSSAPFGVYKLNNGFLSGAAAGLQKKLFKGKGKIALSITDLFNTSTEKYSTQLEGISFTKNDKLESRFFRLLFTYKFGNNVKLKSEKKMNIDDIKNRLNG